jgi:asparagine synthase (glutamine-hydrolysing)
MCGLFGSFGKNGKLSNYQVAEQIKLISHRGPDGNGVFQSLHCTLGHSLLAIQDPGNASQPMFSKSLKSAIVFNGEIYNFKELAKESGLLNLRTSSDTEVVLELIELHGITIIDSFEGMFALAYYEIDSNLLTLARDRFGEKPLFFSVEDGTLFFSSNPVAVSKMIKKRSVLNQDVLSHFFKYQYLPEGLTPYMGISQVAPGTSTTFDQNLSKISRPFSKTILDVHQQFSEVFSKCVRDCMVSDVPIGLSLSGGVDSTITLYEMSRISKDIQTFTVVLDSKNPDAIFSRRAAELFGSTHHEVEIGNEELPELIYHVLSEQPLPFGDSSIVLTYALARYAKQHVKVLISGDGADEILSGYEYYRKYENLTVPSIGTHLTYLRLKFEVELLRKLRRTKDHIRLNKIRELQFVLGKRSPEELWNEDIAVLEDSELEGLMHLGKRARKEIREQKKKFTGVQSVMQWDQKSYLPGDILWKSDTGGMMASLEIRTPFLNSNIVNWASKIEFSNILSKQSLMEKEYDGVIPQEFFTRKKQGFGAPLLRWFSLPGVNDLFVACAGNRNNKVYQYLDFDKSIALSRKSPQTKWNIMALALWLDSNE